jgi:large subunit ribosomal protein L23
MMHKIEFNNIIIQPVVTEKATDQKAMDKYVFKVAVFANKCQVSSALEDLYGVEVLKCNIVNVRGKKKRVRTAIGYTSRWKKAIVTIKKGQSFPFFEGA